MKYLRSAMSHMRSDRSTDYFERNSRYTDSNTRSNLPPGLAPRRGGRSRNR